MSDRDKFLTEAMGECWHEQHIKNDKHIWCICGEEFTRGCDLREHIAWRVENFSTWEGFGKLWEWAPKQEWWQDWFGNNYIRIWYFIDPDRFADAVYEFLKEAGDDHTDKNV